MTERCLTLGCPEVVRLSLQDPCTGLPIIGDANGYALSCIRNWKLEPITREGDASEFVADCGNMVVRDKQDDQLLGYTVSFETSTRSNELEALVTGKEIITDVSLTSIGTYSVAGALSCTSESADPRFIVEGFYKTAKCVSGADHVRFVLPNAQFKVTELDREGTVTFYRYTAETSISLVSALGDGPYHDFPADITTFLALQAGYTSGFDFEESISVVGACGAIPVVSGVTGICDPEGIVTFDALTSPSDGEINITGTGFSGANVVNAVLEDDSNTTIYNSSVIIVPPHVTASTWTDTEIDASDPSFIVNQDTSGCIKRLDFYCVQGYDENFNSGTTNLLLSVDIDPVFCLDEPAPAVESMSSGDCSNVRIVGDGFSQVNHVITVATPDGNLSSYYDPAGPDAGLNPPEVTVNTWNTNLIDITDVRPNNALEYYTLTSVHLLGVGDNPDFGIYDILDFDVISPVIASITQETPGGNLLIEGTCISKLQSVTIVSDAGTIAAHTPPGYIGELTIDSATTAHVEWELLFENGLIPSTITAVLPDNHTLGEWTGSVSVS